MAQLGWIAGIGTLLIFSFIALYTSTLLADSYRFPDPVTGKRNHTYMEAVEATLVPFFNDILALLGAIGYCPMTVYFPVEMYIARKKIQRGSLRWFFLRLLNLACLLVAIAAACGAIEGLNHALKNSKPFKF
ncbi:hypothetical protein DKX38_010511 [Salix brachista]|uniref:Amino acid transporter transmembrane domain-containing protein n=1 Tax=Salix brachista TaxID=2182728 RepID=A0A5N5MDD6_9ROSI|nr:hypothetical protein DKX38_010511 [Salix brachista]